MHAASLRNAASAVLEAGPLAELENERAPGGAERLVDARQHPAQAGRAVRREQPQALGLASRAERVERALERLSTQHGGAGLVELPEARVEPDAERMGLQEPVAEAVDRRDPRAVELTGEVVPPAVEERGADPAPELARRLARVRDDEDRLDVEPALAHRADVALDENRRLPGPRAGRDEDVPGRLDGLELLVVQPRRSLVDDRHARGTRHTVQRSHQAGQPSPFGSWCTSPARIRSA